MPINKYPFARIGPVGPIRPILPIQIVNPDTNISLSTFGLIDTGADECAIPAELAILLGHNLQNGNSKEILTGNGKTVAYAHTTRINIFDVNCDNKKINIDFNNVVCTIHDTPIDFMPNLHTILLGVNNFLSKFILTIAYPDNTFSIRNP